MTQALAGVAPRVFVHGHHHVGRAAELVHEEGHSTCDVVSLDMNGTFAPVAFLNLANLSVTGAER